MDMLEPRAFRTLTPYIVVSNADEAIAFYQAAFGATVRDVARTPDGKVMNAQLIIGDSVLMLNDEFPDYGSVAPKPGEYIPLKIHITPTEEIHAAWSRAIEAGAKETMPLELQFWGDIYGELVCPFGFGWSMGAKAD